MKKILFTALLLGLTMGLNAAPLLVEAYQDGVASIPEDQRDTLILAEVNFSVDTACYAHLVTGGAGSQAEVWLVLDGVNLTPNVKVAYTGGVPAALPMSYIYQVSSGEHTVSLSLASYGNIDYSTICSDAYLQALIFLPDEPPAVAERPEVEPGAQTASVISKGPYVSAPGASELVDASGRVVEAAIVDGKVQISALPPGTYFAKSEERTVVKIVKVD